MSSINNTSSSKSLSDTLNYITQQYIDKLPLIFTIAGLIGFIGNVFTFLQPTLRWNTFCIYTLFGSLIDVLNLFINLFPNYIQITNDNLITPISSGILCKVKSFVLVFLPQLSLDLLILSMIDRYVCTCALTSTLRRFHQLKVVPWSIGITIVVSCIISLYSPLLNDFAVGVGCVSINPILNTVFYIAMHGIMTPVVILLFLMLTYRNIKNSRQRVAMILTNNQVHPRAQFIGLVFVQIFVTNIFVWQWIGICWYYWITANNGRTVDQLAVTYFALALTNNLYYIINVKSFYLSTLTSRVFRDAFKTGLLRCIPRYRRRQ